jgi:small subunit ribosomal protein S4
MSTIGPKVKLARRFGIGWTPKAIRILKKRGNPPGQHGAAGKAPRESVYKRQLLQKQLLRSQYNIREKQLRNYYKKALKSRGNYDELLIQFLETRLDALVLRAGFAPTIYAARQYVSHGHVMVNGQRVNFPSYAVKPGDQISMSQKSWNFLKMLNLAPISDPVAYLQVQPENFQAQLLRLPAVAEVPIFSEPKQVIEFYSR